MLINIHCAKYIVIGAVPMIFLYLYLKLKYYEKFEIPFVSWCISSSYISFFLYTGEEEQLQLL